MPMCVYSIKYYYISLNCYYSSCMWCTWFFSEIRITSAIYKICKSYTLELIFIWMHNLSHYHSCLTGCLGAVIFWTVFMISASAVKNSMWYSICTILNLYYSFIIFIILYVHLLNMFSKKKFKLEISAAVCWSYGKYCMLIVKSTVPLIDHTVLTVWILALPYKLTPSFVEIFFWIKKVTLCKHWLSKFRLQKGEY